METQNEYEIQHGLVNRQELRNHILGLFDDLGDSDFHTMYHLLWSLSAKQLIIKIKTEDD